MQNVAFKKKKRDRYVELPCPLDRVPKTGRTVNITPFLLQILPQANFSEAFDNISPLYPLPILPPPPRYSFVEYQIVAFWRRDLSCVVFSVKRYAY